MAGIIKFDPFRDMAVLRKQMDRLFEDSLAKFRTGEEEFGSAAWSPLVDIYETKDNLVIKAELPGVEKKDVSIEVRNDKLKLRGERKIERDVKEENYHRMECSYGVFQRIFTLPTTVNQDKIAAGFKNGVLEITLPKLEEKKLKQIEIK